MTLRHDELDLHGERARDLEELEVVDDAVMAEPGHCTKGGPAANPILFARFISHS
jgi:hypothetical protein